MIQPISFSEEHIRELQKTSKRDPVLLERAVYAFGLLELWPAWECPLFSRAAPA